MHVFTKESLINRRSGIIGAQSEQYNLDLSVSALFNGVIVTDFPDDDAWLQAYQSDNNCRNIIEMLKNPSLVNTAKLQSTNPIYQSAMWNSYI
jgi:hypothetical protein